MGWRVFKPVVGLRRFAANPTCGYSLRLLRGNLLELFGLDQLAVEAGYESPLETVSVDNELCSGCGICVLACPYEAPHLVEMMERGDLGKKTGKGYFEWPGGERPKIDFSKATRKFNFLWPYMVQVNEASKLIQEGVVDTMDEVDLGITQEAALEEATRCFSCGNCFGCERCWMYCTPSCFKKLPETKPGTYYSITASPGLVTGTGAETSFTYDAKGNRLSTTNALGYSMAYQYDALDRMIASVDPISGETGREYDHEGRTLAISDPLGHLTHFEFDGLGNRLRKDSPDSGVTLWEHDAAGNACHGDVITVDASDNLLHAQERIIAAVGVTDMIIVETPDAVLVAHKDHAQDVKRVTERLDAEGRCESEFHRRVHRPWGSFEGMDAGDRFQVKRLSVKPGAALSLQMHHHRAEHWIVVSGTARVTCDDRTFLLSENQSTYIPIGTRHRLENPGTIPLEIIEVQSGSYLGEDDIVRFEDQYGREGTNT